jgi:hypothetical protein
MKPNHDLTNAVIIPLSQAGITGSLVGAAAGAGAALLEFTHPGAAGVLIGAGAGLWSWFAYRREVARRLDVIAGVQEELQAARTMPQSVDLHVTYNNEGGYFGGDFLRFSITPEQLAQFAKGVILESKNLNVHTWSGNSGIMTRGQYDLFKQELIARGYAAKVNKHASNSATILTEKGRGLFSFLATHERRSHATPLLLKSRAGEKIAKIS